MTIFTLYKSIIWRILRLAKCSSLNPQALLVKRCNLSREAWKFHYLPLRDGTQSKYEWQAFNTFSLRDVPRSVRICQNRKYLRNRFVLAIFSVTGHACEACYRLAQPALGAKESSLTPCWRKRCIQLSLRNAFKQIVPKIRLVNDASCRASCRPVSQIGLREDYPP